MKLGIHLAIAALSVILCSCGDQSDSAEMNEPLSVTGLDPNDEYFVFELADRVADAAEIDDTPESVDRLNSLPEHWRYIEPLIYYYHEVNNGGHHQYFWNSQGVYRHLVAEGLKYYQAEGFIENYREALAIYKPEDYEVSQGGTWEEFQEAYKEDRYDKQDNRFYKIEPDLAELVSKAVHENIEQYQ
jgi:hypothetical protein